MQSNAAKIGVAVASVAAIAILLVVFSSGDDDDAGTQAADAVETTTTTSGSSGGGAGNAAATPPKPSKPKFKTIVTEGGEPKGGVVDLEYEKGERVRVAVESDIAEEIHVHGYDLYEEIPAGGKAKLSFPAEIDGVFEIELHGTGVQIAQLTVSP